MKIYSRWKLPPAFGFLSKEPSMTQQQFKNDADINYIISMYESTGVWNNFNNAVPRTPVYGDFSELPENAQEAYNQILEAKNNFDLLPLEIRERFNYDPAKFFEFVQNPANVDELVRLGLATKTVLDTEVETEPDTGQSQE